MKLFHESLGLTAMLRYSIPIWLNVLYKYSTYLSSLAGKQKPYTF